MRVWEGAAEAIEDAKALKDACYGPGEEEDVAACRALCEKLGIPYHEIDLRAEYRERVIGYFKREYLEGRTPNPCVRCNAELKFGFLLERARQAGIAFDAFATGHYARILAAPSGRGLALARASDDSKDQSYFLYRLPPASLSSLRFPLGGLSKARVREIARSLGLAVADKAESQDFVASGYASLFDGGEGRPGDFVDDAGRARGGRHGPSWASARASASPPPTLSTLRVSIQSATKSRCRAMRAFIPIGWRLRARSSTPRSRRKLPSRPRRRSGRIIAP